MPEASANPTIKCKNCSNEVSLTRPWKKFCSTKCRYDYHNNKSTSSFKVHDNRLSPNELKMLNLIRDKKLTTIHAMRDSTIINRSNMYRILGSLEYKGYIKRLKTEPASWEYLGEPQ